MSETKLCNSCDCIKPRSDFGKRAASIDGLAAKCKACQSAYDKSRANNPDRVKARLDYAKTEGGIAATKRAKERYISKHKDRRAETTRLYRERNEKKCKAHGLVAYAVKTGVLVKMRCEVCDSQNTEAHHDDYSKPLDVRWLCCQHHNDWHVKNGEGLNADN